MLAVVRSYRVAVRVERAAVTSASGIAKLLVVFPGLTINVDPPAAGPEVELMFDVAASTPEHAERAARRQVERTFAPYTALAVAVRQPARTS